MTIADDLLTIKAIQVAIRNAIETKGVTVGDDAFATYPTHILAIQSEVVLTFVLDGADTILDGASVVVDLVPA